MFLLLDKSPQDAYNQIQRKALREPVFCRKHSESGLFGGRSVWGRQKKTSPEQRQGTAIKSFEKDVFQYLDRGNGDVYLR